MYVGRYVRSCMLRFTLFGLSIFVLCIKPGAGTVIGKITLLRFIISRSAVLRSLYVCCICILFVSVRAVMYGSVHFVPFICSFFNTCNTKFVTCIILSILLHFSNVKFSFSKMMFCFPQIATFSCLLTCIS